ncbi:MAG: hypothetical protein B6D59_00615 [Campylobacteraceae bacterium 4484_4]|nr:MAG: hypothetical protein B6D59_00615 [Campylobacteraceae bacterium 4484_4]
MKRSLILHLFLGSLIVIQAAGTQPQQWIEDLQTMIALDTQKENSIAGLDINQNGIRDDVERYVNDKYKKDAFQRDLFLDAARKIQKIITLPREAPLKLHERLDRELLSLYTCRDYILYRNESADIEKELVDKTLFKAKVLNTKERFNAYVQHKQMLPKSFYDLTDDALKMGKTRCQQRYSRYRNSDAKAAKVTLNTK